MGPMERARRIVDGHMLKHGRGSVDHERHLIDAIAADLGFVQLASTPHRDDVAEIKQQHAEMLAALKAAEKLLDKLGPGYAGLAYFDEPRLAIIRAVNKAESQP